MSFDGYIRVSDVNGRSGASFISPDVQRESIERTARAKGVELAEVVDELDVSGGKDVDARKLGRLVRKVEQGQSEGVIVWKLSRFSRSLLDCVTVTSRITDAGGRLLAEDFDNQQPMAKAMLGFLAGFAEEERDQRRAGWAEARRRAVERGVPTFRTPYGYQRDNGGRLVVNGTADVVQRIFEMKAEGEPLTAIKTALAGTPSPKGGTAWSHSTLTQIIRNRVYLGELRHGDNFTPDAHEPIVSIHTFDLAQAKQPHHPPSGTPRSSETLLAGIARCGSCGHTLKVVVGDKGALRYYCKHKGRAVEPCPAPAYARADELDPFAEAWFVSAIEGEGIVAEAVEANRKLSAAQEVVDRAEVALRAYAATGDVLDPETFRHGAGARQATLETARTELAGLRSKAVTVTEFPDGDLSPPGPL